MLPKQLQDRCSLSAGRSSGVQCPVPRKAIIVACCVAIKEGFITGQIIPGSTGEGPRAEPRCCPPGDRFQPSTAGYAMPV